MEEITLRPITLSDTDLIVRWRNSDAVRLNMYDIRILTAEQHRNYFHSEIETKHIQQFIIIVGRVPIGTVFYKTTNLPTAEVGLFIGEDSYRGKGYGFLALKAIIKEVIDDGRFYGIKLRVRSDNQIARNLYEKTGFVINEMHRSSRLIVMELLF